LIDNRLLINEYCPTHQNSRLLPKTTTMKSPFLILSIILLAACSESNDSSEITTYNNIQIELPNQNLNFKNGTVELEKGYLKENGTLIFPTLKMTPNQNGEQLSVAIKWELYNEQGHLFASLMSDKFTAEKSVFGTGIKTFEVKKKIPTGFLKNVNSIKAKVLETTVSKKNFAAWAW